MRPHGYPNHPSRRLRQGSSESGPQAFFDAVLGPRGHRRPVLLPLVIVVFILLPALALSGRPVIPAGGELADGHVNTVATANRSAR
ncbi:MAG TPA: hypothetical protein VF755_23840 [Catenuloplanes sp.]|jgi:hypothetical protein